MNSRPNRSVPMATKPRTVLRELRSLVDRQYRRAYRTLRNLPAIEYRYVVDGGAHRGAFADAFLELHNPARLVLIEPIPELAATLEQRFAQRMGAAVVCCALADVDGEAEFEMNRSPASSSLLPIDPRNSEWFGRDLRVARTVRVPTLTLASLMRQQTLREVDLLKLDLQGAERLVLENAGALLDRVRVIYTEVFFERLYAGAWLFPQMHEMLGERGFKLCGLSNIVHARNGDLVQANATFRQRSL